MTYPAAMTKRQSAEYFSLSVAAFEREVAAGRLPSPITLAKHERWSRAQLDKALAILAGDELGDWRDGSPLYDRAANG
jgi:hypothetical protein